MVKAVLPLLLFSHWILSWYTTELNYTSEQWELDQRQPGRTIISAEWISSTFQENQHRITSIWELIL